MTNYKKVFYLKSNKHNYPTTYLQIKLHQKRIFVILIIIMLKHNK